MTLYLNAQIEAGAQAVQIFDTWAGILTRGITRSTPCRNTREVVRGYPAGGARDPLRQRLPPPCSPPSGRCRWTWWPWTGGSR